DGIRDKLVTGVQTCALPISWEDFGTDDASGVWGERFEFAAAADEPEDLPGAHGRHHVLAHPGFFVVEFLAVQINRFRAVAYLTRSEERRVGKKCSFQRARYL